MTSGRINIGFNMKDPRHKQVKAILDALPKGGKANLIVRAILEHFENLDDKNLKIAIQKLPGEKRDDLVTIARLEHFIGGLSDQDADIFALIFGEGMETAVAPDSWPVVSSPENADQVSRLQNVLTESDTAATSTLPSQKEEKTSASNEQQLGDNANEATPDYYDDDEESDPAVLALLKKGLQGFV